MIREFKRPIFVFICSTKASWVLSGPSWRLKMVGVLANPTQTNLVDIYPKVHTPENEGHWKNQPWMSRCISYWKLWCSFAMLVFGRGGKSAKEFLEVNCMDNKIRGFFSKWGYHSGQIRSWYIHIMVSSAVANLGSNNFEPQPHSILNTSHHVTIAVECTTNKLRWEDKIMDGSHVSVGLVGFLSSGVQWGTPPQSSLLFPMLLWCSLRIPHPPKGTLHPSTVEAAKQYVTWFRSAKVS